MGTRTNFGGSIGVGLGLIGLGIAIFWVWSLLALVVVLLFMWLILSATRKTVARPLMRRFRGQRRSGPRLPQGVLAEPQASPPAETL